MITTPGALAVSRSVKSRPRMTGILRTLKYSGATNVQPAKPVNARLLVLVNVYGGRPDTTKGSCHTVSKGMQHVAVAATTPGIARIFVGPSFVNSALHARVSNRVAVTTCRIVPQFVLNH